MHGRTLAIETSSRRCSLAVAERGRVLALESIPEDRRLTSEVLPAIDHLLRGVGWRANDLSHICYSRGPGSFTGLRVAATIARMLHWSLGSTVIDVPTLEVIVSNLVDPELPPRAVAILDAKRGQVFGAAFERNAEGRWSGLIDATLIEPAALLARVAPPFVVVGEGIA